MASENPADSATHVELIIVDDLNGPHITSSIEVIADMNPNQLSDRTRESLANLPPDKSRRAEAIIALTQALEARANDAADRAILGREYRDTGRIAGIGEKLDPDDPAATG